MRLRPYISFMDYEYLHKWVNDERTHSLWCANKIPYPMTLESLQEVLDKEALDWGGCAYVATTDAGEPIGFFVLSVNASKNSGFLKFVIVNNALRGKGYGTQMSRLMLKFAFEIAGVSSIQLNVFDANESARRCYSKVGFIEEDVVPDAFAFENESWGRCHMVLSK